MSRKGEEAELSAAPSEMAEVGLALPPPPPYHTREAVLLWFLIPAGAVQVAEILQLVTHLHFRMEADFFRNTVSINCLYYCIVPRFITQVHWQIIANSFTMTNNIMHGSAPLPACSYFVIKIKEREGNLPFITRSKNSLPFPWEGKKKKKERN